jgi:hypothetical protein
VLFARYEPPVKQEPLLWPELYIRTTLDGGAMNTQKYSSRSVGTRQLRGDAVPRRSVRALPFRSWRRAAAPAGRPMARLTGQLCPIMLTDITGFSAQLRSDEDRLTLRRIMYDMLQRAFEAARLPWRDLHEDRGDGTLIVIPPDTPATAVAAQALGHLAAALRQHNQSASNALRMQLRVALHAGPVIRDAQGVTGNAINQTARLVQARTLRKHLNETQADLGVIVSAFIYDNVIRQHDGQPIAAADYRKVRFRVKESALTAWMYLTGALTDDEAERMPGRVAVHPPGHRLAAGARPGRDVLAGRRGAGLDHPVVGGCQVRDQDVEVDPGRVRGQRRGRLLEGEPLTVRRRLERDPSRVPFHRRAAEQAGPEAREHPGIGAVEHHLPDPADGRLAHPASAGEGRHGG